MPGEIIRQGDPTDHDGKVIEGSLTDICHGKPIAFIGHKVYCPRCGGDFPIVEGVLTTTLYGKGVAIAGMKTSCGARLIPTQFTDTVEYGGGAQAAASSHAAAPLAAATATAARGLAPAGPAAAAQAMADEEGDAPAGGAKAIKRLFWTYGPDEQAVDGVSRHYVDLNLHVETENYAAGETVQIELGQDDGSELIAGSRTIQLEARVGPDGTAKLMNVFRNKTVEIGVIG